MADLTFLAVPTAASNETPLAVTRVVAPHANLESSWTKWWSRALNDPRDVVFVNLSLGILFTMWPAALGVYALALTGHFTWWVVLPYAALFATWFDRFTLMLHCTSHRPLFNRDSRSLNEVIPWFVGTIMGQTPNAYFVHHLGMHHREGNLLGDLSTTMPFRRDRFSHWLMYWGRFMTIGLWDLYRYHRRGGRDKMVRRLLAGEASFWGLCIVLSVWVSFEATVVAFVGPVVLLRTLMMAGNWGQHAFVDPDEPNNDFKSSITCINSRYNRRCFNDGYHIIHHIKPSLHYTEMPVEFAKNQPLYGEQDAIVFDGLDFFEVWLLLMLGQKRVLAKRFVQLPGAPRRGESEILALFERRLQPFPADWAPTPAAAE